MSAQPSTMRGFSLVELVISMAILSVVGLLGAIAVHASTTTVSTTEAQSQVQSCVRDTLRVMRDELQMASKRANASLIPPLQTVQITQNPAVGSPVEISFQTPTDASATQWSRLIRYRFVYEDVNNNNRLDDGEDADEDGVLTRRIVRMQDRNGDGDTADADEMAPVGGGNDLRDVTIARDGDVVTVTLTAARLAGVRRTNPVTATETARIYLLN